MNLSSRNSSTELLRLILMTLIVIHHGIVHGLGFTSLSPKFDTEILVRPEDSFPFLVINSLCIVGVNCFILISGFYGIKLTKRKIYNLLTVLLFYTVLLNVIPAIIEHNYLEALKRLLFLSHSPYWFVIDYIFLMFFAPGLNLLLDKMNRKYIVTLLIAMTIMSVYFGFLWNNKVNDNGYSLFQFIYLYCIGHYLRIVNLKKSISFLIYLVSSIITALIMFVLMRKGAGEWAWKITFYNNPLVLIAAIGLFLVFKNWKLYSKKNNYLSKSALAIYLIQSSIYISSLFYNAVSHYYQTAAPSYIIILIIMFLSIGVVVFSLIIDIIRRAAFKHLC